MLATEAAAPAPERRFRGTGKHQLWKRPEEVSVIVLPLSVPGAQEARRLEKLFAAMFTLKRALQHEIGARIDAYWAGHQRRKQDAGSWRRELGLTRTWLEHRAYEHLERSRWLGHHLTRALALHMADEVWNAADRHLFRRSQRDHRGQAQGGQVLRLHPHPRSGALAHGGEEVGDLPPRRNPSGTPRGPPPS
jgi:hypothetical protein